MSKMEREREKRENRHKEIQIDLFLLSLSLVLTSLSLFFFPAAPQNVVAHTPGAIAAIVKLLTANDLIANVLKRFVCEEEDKTQCFV